MPDPCLHRYLPYTFPDGRQVRRFAKHCPACRDLVDASQMIGVAAQAHGQLALAAEAHCNRCGHDFPVACVISPDKQVHRVWIPLPAWRWCLRTLTEPAPLHLLEETLVNEAVSLPNLQVQHIEEVVAATVERAEESIGRFDAQPIPAWIRVDGLEFLFERVAVSEGSERLSEDEWLLDRQLVYRRSVRPRGE